MHNIVVSTTSFVPDTAKNYIKMTHLNHYRLTNTSHLYGNNTSLDTYSNSSYNYANETNPYSTEDEFIEPDLQWGVLALSILILATILGNVLVCLAVCWEHRLQNMTNYFLMSLAIADLLVALLVMPVGMVIELYGRFPFSPSMCVIYIAADVLMCTASIWHMCTMSMDRYFTLKYPMKYGRNKTKTMVITKITFVWVISLSICSPIVIMGFSNPNHVLQDGICAPNNPAFVIYGSILAFYVPLTIMVVTYILTTHILHTNQKLMQKISEQHKLQQEARKELNGGITPGLYKNMPFLAPNTSFPRLPKRSSIDISENENMTFDGLSGELDMRSYDYEGTGDTANGYVYEATTENVDFVVSNEESSENQCLMIANEYSDRRNSLVSNSISASQPNLVVDKPLQKSGFCGVNDELNRSQSFKEPKSPHMNKSPSSVNSRKKFHLGKTLTLPKQARRNSRSQPDLSDTRYSVMHLSSSQHSLALPNARKGLGSRGHLRSNGLRKYGSHLGSNSCHEKLSANQHREISHTASNPLLAQCYATSKNGRHRYSSIKSINSVLELESVKNFDSLSNASSVNSIMSREYNPALWEDFERPVMLQKLSKIEAEMDLCIRENDVINKDNPKCAITQQRQHSTNSINAVSESAQNNSTQRGSRENPLNEVYEYNNRASKDALNGVNRSQILLNHNPHNTETDSMCPPSSSVTLNMNASNKCPNSLSSQTHQPDDVIGETDTSALNSGINQAAAIHQALNPSLPVISNIERVSLYHNEEDKEVCELQQSGTFPESSLCSSVITTSNTTVIIPPVCISSPSPINSRSSQASHSDLERDLSFKSTSSHRCERDFSFKSNTSYSHSEYNLKSGDNSLSDNQPHNSSKTNLQSKTCDEISSLNNECNKSTSQKVSSEKSIICNGSATTTPTIQLTCYPLNGSISDSKSSELCNTLPITRLTNGTGCLKINSTTHSRSKTNGHCGGTNGVESKNNKDGKISSECLSTSPMTPKSSLTNSKVASPKSENKTLKSVTLSFDFEEETVWTRLKSKTRRSVFNKRDKTLKRKGVISKKTATNERKASKVLCIIIGVFVILWTPFFIINILTSVCDSCHKWLTPPLFTTMTWLGYLSSLMNPIIYTMFNTSFRNAFQKILTCQYRVCACCLGNQRHRRNSTWHTSHIRSAGGGATVTSYGRCLSASNGGGTPKRNGTIASNSVITTTNSYRIPSRRICNL